MTSKRYNIGPTKQLIDLNENTINFAIEFRVISENQAPFDIVVVDQATLDSNPNIEYNHVTTGELSGSVKNNDNVYKNFYILIKAPSECVCIVDVIKNEIPPDLSTIQPPASTEMYPTNSSSNGMKWGVIVVVVIAISAAVWWYFSSNQEKGSKSGSRGRSSTFSSSSSSDRVHSMSPPRLHTSNKGGGETLVSPPLAAVIPSSSSSEENGMAMSPTSAKILQRLRGGV